MAETDIVAFRAQNTPEDIRALSRVANRLANAKLLRVQFYAVLVPAVALVVLTPTIAPWVFGEESLVSILLPVFVALSVLVLVILYSRAAARSALDPRGALARGFDVEAGPDGLRLHNDQFETLYRWPAILFVRVTKTHVFLFVDRRMAVVVARRFFASDEAFERFVAIVRQHSDPAARATR